MKQQQTTFENIVAKGEIAHDDYTDFLYCNILDRCFKICLLQICCMWERVKRHGCIPFPHTYAFQADDF